MRIPRLFLTEKPDMARALAAVLGQIEEHRDKSSASYMICQGGNWVTHARGHLLEVLDPEEIDPAYEEWASPAIPIIPETIPKKAQKGKEGHLSMVGDLMRRADSIVIATDIDREGSLIARELIEYFDIRAPLYRLPLNKREESDIRDALDRMEKERDQLLMTDYALAREAELRSYIDWVEGMSYTRACTAHLNPPDTRGVLHFGGVQTRLVALVCARERAIREFRPRDHYHIRAEISLAGPESATDCASGAAQTLQLRYQPGGKIGTHEDRRLYDREDAEKIRTAAERWAGALKITRSVSAKSAPRPYNLSTLQSDAGRRHGWSPSTSLDLVQSLYEKGLLSYPRSSRQYYPSSMIPKMGRILDALGTMKELKGAIPDRPLVRQGRNLAYDTEEMGAAAHDALQPLAASPAALAALDGDERLMFLLVARNFIANHCADLKFDVTRIAIDLPPVLKSHDPVTLSAEYRQLSQPGWKQAYPDEVPGTGGKGTGAKGVGGNNEAGGDEEGEAMPSLPPGLRNGAQARCSRATILTSSTTPPGRFLFADLPLEMGNLIRHVEDPELRKALEPPDPDLPPKGLGTDATRDAHISDVMDMSNDWVRKVVTEGQKGKVENNSRKAYLTLYKKTRQVMPTARGIFLIESLQRHLPELADPVSRARLEYLIGDLLSAGSEANIDRRCETIRAALRLKVTDNVKLFHDIQPLDPSTIRGAEEFGRREVTRPMRELILKLRKERGLTLPDGVLTDHRLAKEFLDQHASRQNGGTGEGQGGRNDGITRPQIEALAKMRHRLGLDHDDKACQSMTRTEASQELDRLRGKIDRLPASEGQKKAVRARGGHSLTEAQIDALTQGEASRLLDKGKAGNGASGNTGGNTGRAASSRSGRYGGASGTGNGSARRQGGQYRR